MNRREIEEMRERLSARQVAAVEESPIVVAVAVFFWGLVVIGWTFL